MSPLILFGFLSAQAASFGGVYVGGTSALNDPFIYRRGPVLGAELALTPSIGLVGFAAGFPVLDRHYLRPVTDHLVNNLSIAPDVSPMLALTSVQMGWWPLHSERDGFGSRVGIQYGLGAVYTRDDLELMQASPDDPVFADTAKQIHPSVHLGLSGEAYVGPVGARLAFEQMAYFERYADGPRDLASYRMFTVAVTLRPPLRAR